MSDFQTLSVNVFLKLNETTSCMFCFLGSGVGFFLFFFMGRVWFLSCSLDSHLTRQNRKLFVCTTLGCTHSVLLPVL